eukprot:scaffold28606_cov161-Amphora_coffeaeformis.AAC.1
MKILNADKQQHLDELCIGASNISYFGHDRTTAATATPTPAATAIANCHVFTQGYYTHPH